MSFDNPEGLIFFEGDDGSYRKPLSLAERQTRNDLIRRALKTRPEDLSPEVRKETGRTAQQLRGIKVIDSEGNEREIEWIGEDDSRTEPEGPAE